ncbi:hypothetical protein CBP27_09210 [Fischerella thermalis WC542]|nr:hypothetical protein CBP18_18810 [Fischerella thermalis WC119]PLZ08862.1 hypothetical protein CBP17_15230 [Fischerella thermalis WC114]PLZ13085.1 hypothetical protein CBP19_10410 [Fischerella thermalis WC1110]PLZ17065.1 hypothetical protein CBP30_21055 [Fischerella thermalis WC157]PLZ20881.1 hypothetical protein CBP29_16215 [Fischerella thermalis WC341]PLZ31343.1 hypothetical protein CBP28_06770 [Fischerella thermalis WC559]PLZ33428.1 hypothetical protein CBP10_07905 [Fischerella thermalis
MLIIDSQAVKNTCNASVQSKGFCHYKCTNGIKRHLAVDTLGLPFFTHCTQANVSDDNGLIELLSQNLDYFRAKPVNIPKITILLDHGYHPDKITSALQALYPRILTKYQIDCGAQVIQIFDSWAGCLTPQDYETFALPYQQQVVRQVKATYPHIPLALCVHNSAAILHLMPRSGVDIIHVDWTAVAN